MSCTRNLTDTMGIARSLGGGHTVDGAAELVEFGHELGMKGIDCVRGVKDLGYPNRLTSHSSVVCSRLHIQCVMQCPRL